MIKNTERLNQLFISHLGQSATDLEQEEFWGYVNDPMFEEEVKELIAGIYLNPENVSMISEEERTSILAQVFSTQRNALLKNHSTKLWPRIAGIAAAVIGIAIGIWFYTNEIASSRRASRNDVAYAQDIAPGKNTATLTVNGKSMLLSEAQTGIKIDNDKFTYNDGSPLSPQGEALLQGEHSIVTATTPRGGTYEFVLQDGTKVWLNADSKLEFVPDYRNKKQRVVKLEGEGYFEVAKDKTKPFIVESAGQKVEVLGTHFNVNTYKNNGGIKTTLLEGSVNVNGTILKPNQQSVILPGGKVNVEVANANATAWVNGKFRFDNTSFEDVMEQIERWYDVEVVYPGGVPDEQFTGDINRNNNLSAVLKMMKIMKVNFKVEGKKIIVSK